MYAKTLEEAAQKMKEADQKTGIVEHKNKKFDISAILAQANLNTTSHLYNEYGTTEELHAAED